jgi:hypothetical protein
VPRGHVSQVVAFFNMAGNGKMGWEDYRLRETEVPLLFRNEFVLSSLKFALR